MQQLVFRIAPFLFLFAAGNAFAQTPVDLGVKAGISIPNLKSGSSANPINSGYSSRVGPDAAVHVEFHFTPHFSIEPQLEYCSQGGKKDGKQAFVVPAEMKPLFPPGQVPEYLHANYNSEAKFNYLMLPILAKYRYTLAKRWGFYVAAGPFVSMVLSAKNVTSGNSSVYLDAEQTMALPTGPQSFDHTENIKDDLHKFNAGISGHIGFAYLLGPNSIFIEGGGNYGLINIQKGEENGKNNTGAASVVLGYSFRLQ